MGFSLTVGSLGSSKLVVTGGLAELFSGSISMGLGAYLASVNEKQHYESERGREEKEVRESPEEETEEIYRILCAYGPERHSVAPFVNALKRDPEQWIQVRDMYEDSNKGNHANHILSQFMMDFELRLEEPAPREAYISAITMGVAYFIGK